MRSLRICCGLIPCIVSALACVSCAMPAAQTGQPVLDANGSMLTAAEPSPAVPPGLLPVPLSLPRAASATYIVDPSLPFDWSPGETPDDPFVMQAPGEEYRFAMYQAAPVNALSRPQQLVLNLDGSDGTVWLGLSNYSRNRWDWHQLAAPFSTWMEFAIPGDTHDYYNASNTFSFCLLVYDNDTLSFGGAHVNTSSHPYLDPAGWEIYNLTSGSQYGKHNAACLIDGRPALIYTRDDNKDVYFAAADSALPASAANWTSHAAVTGGDWGGRLSIIECNNVPCIGYEDTIKQDIFFAAASSSTPSSAADWTAHRPDTSGQTALRLAAYEGVPLLVYVSSSGLSFARPNVSGIPAGEEDWIKVLIDTGEYYEYPQLAVITGGPVVAYQCKDAGTNTLLYAWSNSITDQLIPPGDSWTICLVDDANTNSGNNVALAVDDDGKAWISYTNIDIVQFMKFALADVNTPTTAAQFRKAVVYAKEQTHTGQWQSMARINARPFISFIETGSGSLEGLHAAYANRSAEMIAGPEAFDHELLDSAGSYYINEETTAFALSDGRPAVVYRTTAGLMFGYFAGTWP